MSDVSFVRARASDAELIAQLRLAAWETTYRGIYPDEVIDSYDVPERAQRDREKIADPELQVYLIRCDGQAAGYFMLRVTETVYIAALYVLKPWQHRGIGRQAFALTRKLCRGLGVRDFTCNCNAHNLPAQGFYRAMGGVIVRQDTGHANWQEDQVTFSFMTDI